MSKLSELLSDPKFLEDAAKRFVEQMEQEHKNLKDFYESERFFNVIEKLPDVLSCDDFHYGVYQGDITEDDFDLLVNSIEKFNEAEDITEVFPTYQTTYKNLKVVSMHGQGTITTIFKE